MAALPRTARPARTTRAARHLPPGRTALAAATLAALAGAGASAQTAPPPAAAASAPAQVIEVTAQGRKQEVMQVPIAIQAISPEQIAKLGTVNIAEIASFVPGLEVDATEPTQPVFTMRGLATADFGIGTDSPVGVYVNGLYAGKTGGALLNFNDIQRVEVLKGPQGTLFGRNSAGGAVAIYTHEPARDFAASGLLRLGNQQSVHTEAMLNLPLGDTLALRLAGVAQRREGWARDEATGERAPHDNAWGTRLSLGWTPDNDTHAVLGWDHEKLDQRARPVWAVTPTTPFFAAPGDTSGFVDPRDQPLRSDAVGAREERLLDALSLRVEHDLGWATASSLSGWRTFRTENVQDNDGTAHIASHLTTGNFEKTTSWQQEFRLAGNTPLVDWLVGLSLSHDDARQTSQVNTYSNSIDTLLTNVYGLPPFATFTALAQGAGFTQVNLLDKTWQEAMHNTGEYSAQALFADAIWHLGPRTNLTTGIRFTRDEKKFSWHNPLRTADALDAQLALFTPEFFQMMEDAGALAPGQGAQLAELAEGLRSTNLTLANPAWYDAPEYAQKRWTNTSPRLVIDHHLDKDTMVFGSITRGYQAGGFNSVTTEIAGGAFGPETVTSYEAGVKGKLPGSGFSYGASLFHYLFKNLQSIALDTCSSNVPFYVITTSDVQATGADLEANWQLSRQLRVYGAAQLIDQTYKRQTNLSACEHDKTGQPYGTPSTTLTAGVDVAWPLADGQAQWTLQAAYRGPTRCNDDSVTQGNCLKGPGFDVGEARQRVDTRLGWEPDSRKWGLALVVNNLFDKQYINWASNLSSVVGSPYYAGLTEPRRIQLEFKAKL